MRLMRDPALETRLTETQLGQVVAELSRLSQQREDEQSRGLDREQVVEVLKELDLPVDLLDEAMEQLRRREALAKERRRKTWILAVAFTIFLSAMVLLFIAISQRNAVFGLISAEPGRITLVADDGGNLDKVSRNGQEVVYRVLLRDVPTKEYISLTCKWIDPSGRVFHQNTYETRLTDKTVWPTSCRCQLGSAAPRGTWRVEMLLRGRLLSAATFEVE
jgi:hypothetical protein